MYLQQVSGSNINIDLTKNWTSVKHVVTHFRLILLINCNNSERFTGNTNNLKVRASIVRTGVSGLESHLLTLGKGRRALMP